mmetsp:Transcript_19990/g.28721  ORF Transcript_19990/g.28721 Transcript_19990/m.28721 type:complete len:290 (+) Transcript_19990:62-931(+)|eukprot:CAMPEP_0185025506 /NCGR_PEP_ID=MMETSP1103-20130426/8432_1 /TAXON_ID=36769 /ORGANISM="Paraphysomonas bandaiensis, Strain Caron Lab Isolate" /LENGTH=289 /DNA_ID=CAMNT_0027558713 /DNA_START=67 /DNA_END=936 /DNA_ORIENTATION=-
MTDQTFNIETATAQNGGLEFIFENGKREGWEPGIDDMSVFPAVDPTGFFVGIVEGRIVGCVSGVKYNDDYGFIGYYIVLPEERGKGYGLKLFQHAVKYLGDRNIGLDGLLVQVPNYQKSGFQSYHATPRFQGNGTGPSESAAENIVPLSAVDAAQLAAYDRKHFPAPRAPWLQKWMGGIPGWHTGAYMEGGSIRGYAVMRPCITGFRLGPLYADTPDIARKLMAYMRAQLAENQTFFIDVPECNQTGIAFAKDELGLTKLWDCIRMYTKGEPEGVNWGEVYGVSSLELG